MPLVSVVIPTYNRADVLNRAIDSVLEQTVEDVEVIIVDDGSTDDTQEILASYETPRVRSIVHATNRGANVARNTGIEYARGEYIAFLDSDDEWIPTKLERQLQILACRSDDWVAAYCGFDVETPGRSGRFQSLVASVLERVDDEPQMEGGEELIGDVLADNVHPGAGSTLLVEADVVRDIGGFDESLDRFQDPEIVVRVLEEGKLAYVDEALVVRHETGSPPAAVVASASEEYLESYEDTVDRLEADGYEIRSSHALVVAKHYFAEGRRLRGMYHLRKAAIPSRHYPGLLWAVGVGVRRRPIPIVAFTSICLALAFLSRATHRS